MSAPAGLAASLSRVPSVLTAARGLAGDRPWVLNAGDPELVWGRCRGSSGTPYDVLVDLRPMVHGGEVRWRCTCPSRVQPCKHVLALLLRSEGGSVPEPLPRPPFVVAFVDGPGDEPAPRRAEEALATRKPPGEVADPVAQAKRAAQRRANVDAGALELGRVLDDLARRGFAEAHGEPWGWWQQLAARMVDAQAKGLARGVSGVGAAIGGPDWPVRGLAAAGRLRLLLDAWGRIDALLDEAPALAAEVRSLVGFETTRDSVLQTAGVEDTWDVVGQHLHDDGSLVTVRTWLLGRTIGGFALVLDHGPSILPPRPAHRPGEVVVGAAHRYPGAVGLRSLLVPASSGEEETLGPDPAAQREALSFAVATAVDVAGLLSADAALLARSPWHDATPAVLGPVVPVAEVPAPTVGPSGRARRPQGADRVLLVDEQGLVVAAAGTPLDLVAAGRGAALHVVGEWDGDTFLCLAAIADGVLVELDPGRAMLGARSPAGRGPLQALAPLASLAVVGAERKASALAALGAAPSSDGGVAIGDLGAVALAVGDDALERKLLRLGGVAAVAARAGQSAPSLDRVLPTPADPPERKVGSPAAALALARALALAGTDRGARSLALTWLDAAHEAGVRPPDHLVPALLDLAALGEAAAVRVLPRLDALAAWLAPLEPRWRATVEPDDGLGAAGTERALAGGGEVDGWWRSAEPAERSAVLEQLVARAAHGAAAALVQATWADDTSKDRTAAIAALAAARPTPGAPDPIEAVLEAALADRHRDVRTAAVAGMRRRPASAYGRRMAARVGPLVDLGRGGPPRPFEVPAALPADWVRDGVEQVANVSAEERTARVVQALVSATPLVTWTAGDDPGHDGGAALGAALGRLDAVGPGIALAVAVGWCRAAVDQADAAWAKVLLGWSWLPDVARHPLLAVLDIAERAAVVAAVVVRDERTDPVPALRLALALAAPWSPRLATAVVEAARHAFTLPSPPAPRRGEGRRPDPAAIAAAALEAAADRVALTGLPQLGAALEDRPGDPVIALRFGAAADLATRRAAIAALLTG